LKLKIKNFESNLYEMKDNKEERLERIKSQKVLSNNPKNVNGEVNNLIKEMEHKNDEIKQIRIHINEQIG
jgi:N-methylhydantoinase A/oxoprolinase/acetone carboxylase beta subunit